MSEEKKQAEFYFKFEPETARTEFRVSGLTVEQAAKLIGIQTGRLFETGKKQGVTAWKIMRTIRKTAREWRKDVEEVERDESTP